MAKQYIQARGGRKYDPHATNVTFGPNQYDRFEPNDYCLDEMVISDNTNPSRVGRGRGKNAPPQQMCPWGGGGGFDPPDDEENDPYRRRSNSSSGPNRVNGRQFLASYSDNMKFIQYMNSRNKLKSIIQPQFSTI